MSSNEPSIEEEVNDEEGSGTGDAKDDSTMGTGTNEETSKLNN